MEVISVGSKTPGNLRRVLSSACLTTVVIKPRTGGSAVCEAVVGSSHPTSKTTKVAANTEPLKVDTHMLWTGLLFAHEEPGAIVEAVIFVVSQPRAPLAQKPA